MQLKMLSKSNKFEAQHLVGKTSLPETHFDRYISYALAAAHRSVSQSLTARMKQFGVKVEAWRIMEALDDDKRLTMGALARIVLITPSTLSKLVDRMVSDGLVHRQVSPADQRQINLLLTDLGRKRMMQIRDIIDAEDTELANQLGPKNVELLLGMLQAIK